MIWKGEMLGLVSDVGRIWGCGPVSPKAAERMYPHCALCPSLSFTGLKYASRLIFGCRVGACTIKREREVPLN